MIKVLSKEAPNDLLAAINHLTRFSWILSAWKIAKIIPFLKNHGEGYNTIDNIGPIALTSNLAKLIERIL